MPFPQHKSQILTEIVYKSTNNLRSDINMEKLLSTDHFLSAAKSYIKQVYGVLSIFGNFFSSIIILWLLLTIVK